MGNLIKNETGITCNVCQHQYPADYEWGNCRKTHKSRDGKTASDILRERPDCPITMPSARTMTTAAIDFYGRQDAIIQWYNTNREGK